MFYLNIMCSEAFTQMDRGISLINSQNTNTAERKAERLIPGCPAVIKAPLDTIYYLDLYAFPKIQCFLTLLIFHALDHR